MIICHLSKIEIKRKAFLLSEIEACDDTIGSDYTDFLEDETRIWDTNYTNCFSEPIVLSHGFWGGSTQWEILCIILKFDGDYTSCKFSSINPNTFPNGSSIVATLMPPTSAISLITLASLFRKVATLSSILSTFQ